MSDNAQLVSIERDGNTYVARNTAGTVWTVEIRLDMSGTPFREEVVWPAAAVVAVGGGNTVHFLAAESGAIVNSLSLGNDLFGHFGPSDSEMLYVLGWRNVVAVEKSLAVRWISKDLAIDGITWRNRHDDRIQLAAEMDPPGGWVDIELDALTGREITREDRAQSR